VLGFFLGILPGMGTIVPTFLSYTLERRLSRHPERFGEGAIEGVAGPESANNAATAGSMIPLLTLGIPPSAAVAVLAAGFLMHGVPPGPLLIAEHPALFWGVVTSMYTGNVLLLLLNLPLVGLWARLITIPYGYLFPVILLLCAVGTYSVGNNPWDVLLMAVFGLLGYALRKLDFPLAPLILAFVLGRLFEETVRQSLARSRGSFAVFAAHPVAQVAWAVAVILVLASVVAQARRCGLVRRGSS
jgi:putative tricarboxylic transport membrane protein